MSGYLAACHLHIQHVCYINALFERDSSALTEIEPHALRRSECYKDGVTRVYEPFLGLIGCH